MDNEFIFVYGTLRRDLAGGMHRLLADQSEFVAYGLMQGRLYEVNGYPGALESEGTGELVFGEIYRIYDRDLLSLLDEYEECSDNFPQPHEYERKLLEIITPGGKSLSAWGYVFKRDVMGLKWIESGDYVEYFAANSPP